MMSNITTAARRLQTCSAASARADEPSPNWPVRARSRVEPWSPSRRAFLGATAAGAAFVALPSRSRAEPASAAISALAFDQDALLLVGTRLSRSNNGGGSWIALPSPGEILSVATHPKRPGRIVAGLASGGVSVSDDGGRSWRARASGLPGGGIMAVTVAAAQPDLLYAAVRDDGLWKSENAGASWSLAMDRPWIAGAERSLLALASVNLATGMGGIWIYAGTEQGLTRVPDCLCRWQEVQPGNALDALAAGGAPPATSPLPAGELIHDLASAPSSPDALYAALPSGVWASRDAGVVWSRVAQGRASAVATHPANLNHVIAALEGGLKQSRDGGATWTALAAI